MKRLALIASSSVLVGCIGTPPEMMREQPASSSISSKKTAQVIFQCLSTNPALSSLHASQIRVVPRAGGLDVVEIGAFQAGSFRIYYSISIIPDKDGSRVEIRDTGGIYIPLSRNELTASVQSCVE